MLMLFVPVMVRGQQPAQPDTLVRDPQPDSLAHEYEALPLPSEMASYRRRTMGYGQRTMERIEQVLDSVHGLIASSTNTFRGVGENKLTNGEAIRSVFDRLAAGKETVRIVHIGDSHIRGHIYSQATRGILEATFGSQAVVPKTVNYGTTGILTETGLPGLVYQTVAVNGATNLSFTKKQELLDQIASLKPDLIIMSFGTNEAHGKGYSEATHTQQMSTLVGILRELCPQASFLLTTSPGSYQDGKPNPRTRRVAANIMAFAAEQGFAAWDMYNILGGDANILRNWNSKNMQRGDKIHFTPGAYRLMGWMLGEALLKIQN